MENITVTGDFGRKPSLEFTGAEPSPELLVEVLREGDGPEVEPGDQIQCHYLGQVWNGNVFDNSYDRGQALASRLVLAWSSVVGMTAWSGKRLARACCCLSLQSTATVTLACRRPVSAAVTPSSS